MAKSSDDYFGSLGCSPALLAIICFGLLVAILLASISGADTGGSSGASVNSSPATALPNLNNAGSVQVITPLVDCSQSADEAQRQQCEQAQGGALCASGCVEYPLRCELEVIKGDIDKANGQKLYYMQQHPQYTQILIEPETGERWFCFAAAAERAGWVRAP